MLMSKFTILTLFPEMIQSYLGDALISRAIKNNLLSVDVVSLRNYSDDKYKSVDDTIYGGGDGMLLRADILEKAILDIKKSDKCYLTILLSPQGIIWSAEKAKKTSQQTDVHFILICGRYGGVDQRFIDKYVDQEISIGDFVLSGGELAALVLIESTSRFISGVLGDQQSVYEDSFENGLLEAPQYTKPQTWNDLSVPDVLLSGNHKKISEWRKQQSLVVTEKKRPDLFLKFKKNNLKVQL